MSARTRTRALSRRPVTAAATQCKKSKQEYQLVAVQLVLRSGSRVLALPSRLAESPQAHSAGGESRVSAWKRTQPEEYQLGAVARLGSSLAALLAEMGLPTSRTSPRSRSRPWTNSRSSCSCAV